MYADYFSLQTRIRNADSQGNALHKRYPIFRRLRPTTLSDDDDDNEKPNALGLVTGV